MLTPFDKCNLLACLPKPPWTKPLNWDLHMTDSMEEQIPFHLYVQSGDSLPSDISSFPQFGKLPAELQLRILTFCSAPTLFHIMRASSMLRNEASKLFWASPNTYYFIESVWLFEGGLPGYTFCDLNFLACVQNVEVEYGLVSPHSASDDTEHNRVGDFWKTLKRRFPSVRKVVINKSWGSMRFGRFDPIPCCLQVLLQACPPEIDVSAFILEEKPPPINNRSQLPPPIEYQRHFYRPASNAELPLYWDRETVLMPTKSFHGPVGESERLRYKGTLVSLRECALVPLAIEALDRHHFDEGKMEPFSCPSDRCVGRFDKAGQWTKHAVEWHSEAEFHNWNRCNTLPEVLRDVFEKHENDTKRKKREIYEELKKMYDAWNEEGSEKRREMEKGWVNQLENDEAWDTGQEAENSELFHTFSSVMEQDADMFNNPEENFL